jgi:FMN phosphatase YigB (HAD superfamily)
VSEIIIALEAMGARGIIIALVAMSVWEIGRRIILWLGRTYYRQRALRLILQFRHRVTFARSTIWTNGQPAVRESDVLIEQDISRHAKHGTSTNTQDIDLSRPTDDIVCIGSPRHNELAAQIQQYFDLPFQFIFTEMGRAATAKRLAIVTEFGEELLASPDYRGEDREQEVDYGLLLVGHLAQRRKLIWLAGIHGIGTLGVCKYLKERASRIHRDMPNEQDRTSAHLLRVTYKLPPSGERDRAEIQSVELLGAVRTVNRRNESPCRAVVFDFGNVLMDFDRNRTYRAVAHHLVIEGTTTTWQEVRDRIESTDWRDRYELGQLDTDEFCAGLRSELGVTEAQLPDSLIADYWSGIFWESTPLLQALQDLKQAGTCLALLSNTNALHFDRIRREYADMLSLFDVILLSYEQKVAKPDAEIFKRVITEIRGKCGKSQVDQILYIDDKKEYVDVAEDMGMKGFVYRAYPQLVYWLRQQGCNVR